MDYASLMDEAMRNTVHTITHGRWREGLTNPPSEDTPLSFSIRKWWEIVASNRDRYDKCIAHGVSFTIVYNWASGRQKPKRKSVERICNLIGCDYHDLMVPLEEDYE